MLSRLDHDVAGAIEKLKKSVAISTQFCNNRCESDGQRQTEAAMSRPSSTVADHAFSPRNVGAMESPDAVGQASLDGRAPRLTIYVRVDGTRVVRATFQCFGCGFSIAACSALTEMMTGASIDDCMSFSASGLMEMLGGMPPERQFCAQMAIEAMRDALMKLR